MTDGLPIVAMTAANAALISFGVYMLFVFVLAGLANREQEGKSFLSEYFLGSRNLGLWAFALTYAATAASGGSFMGFPSLIYTHGWALVLWLGSYVVVPLVGIGLLSRRLNQVARKSGSITVPEMMRKRLGSAQVGHVATVLLVFFQFFFLLAQFKAGAKIMTTLLQDVEVYQALHLWVDRVTDPIPWVRGADGDYLLCLGVFAVSVIAYTAWGGFRAVVWTDMMQGIIMGLGVLLMLGFVLVQVGGLSNATRELARQVPPQPGLAKLTLVVPAVKKFQLDKGAWISLAGEGNGTHRVFLRTSAMAQTGEGGAVIARPHVGNNASYIPVIRVRTPLENTIELGAIQAEIEKAKLPEIHAEMVEFSPYKYGDGQPGVYVNVPGPSNSSTQGFLPIMLLISFFCFWPFAGAAQPSYMARQMAFRDIPTLRRSIVFVMVYFSLIYFPLVVIFTCGRVVLPGWEIDPDRIMPEMAAHLTANAGVPWLAGLLVAAPFAAVMSSVDSFLLLVSGSVVRDIYQQARPNATEARMKKVTYATTVIVGLLAVLATLNPPDFLQSLIVFGSGGLGASFLMPVILALYWPRLTGAGTVAGMLSGGATMALLYLVGYIVNDKFAEYLLFGLHPFIWSVAVSAIVTLLVAHRTAPPEKALVEKYFGSQD